MIIFPIIVQEGSYYEYAFIIHTIFHCAFDNVGAGKYCAVGSGPEALHATSATGSGATGDTAATKV
jgi:hypothetical protein